VGVLGLAGHATGALAQTSGPQAGQAATPPSGQPGQLSEIVVTAARRQSTALSTPIDISAITGADLERQGIGDFHELARSVPGLVYNSQSIRDGGATNAFILHGLNLDAIGSGDAPLPTFAPVSVYLNETPVFVNLHLADVQRVEVLRGPQATLYGDASIAGTVRILFNQPDLLHRTLDLSSSLSGTDHSTGPNYSIDVAANQPINAYAGFRVAAGYTFDNGFISAPHLVKYDNHGIPVLATPADVVHSLPVQAAPKNNVDDADLAYIRPMLLFQKDQWKVLLTYQHQYEYAQGPDEDSYPGGPAPTAYSSTGDAGANPPFQNDGFDAAFPSTFRRYQSGEFMLQPLTRNVDVASVEMSYDLGFATFTSVTSGYEQKSDATTDGSGFYQKSLGFAYEGYPRLTLKSRRTYDDYAFIEEDRLVSNNAGPLTYSIGFFYANQRNHYLQHDWIPGISDYLAGIDAFDTGTDLAYVDDRHIHFEDLAGFGEVSYHITPKWQINGGVRVFRQKLDLSSIIQLPVCGFYCSTDGVNPLGQNGGSNQEITSKALFKANTSYQFSPHFLGYFTYSQGERRGGANGVPTKGYFAESPAFLFFHPDTVDNYELGLKGRLFGTLEFSAAGYYIDWHDPQVNVSTPVGAFPAAVNGKGAESHGVDFEARYRLNSEITLSATYGWNRAKLTSPIEVGGVTYGAAGTILPGTPEHNVSLSADYQRPISGPLSFDAHADVTWRSNMNTSLTPSENVNVDGFAMLNLSMGVSTDKWRAGLFADNATNTRGILSASNIEQVDVRSINNRLSRPLTIGVRLNYKFE
jgi:outer membrane receptor protein involved in Fe transport